MERLANVSSNMRKRHFKVGEEGTWRNVSRIVCSLLIHFSALRFFSSSLLLLHELFKIELAARPKALQELRHHLVAGNSPAALDSLSYL